MSDIVPAAGSFPVIPQLSVNASRRCTYEGDVNCFTSIHGCDSPIQDMLRCNDPEGWSVSLVFVGTGAELPRSTNCTLSKCEWSIDNIDCGWPSTPPVGLGPMIYAKGLLGGGDAQHTLTMSSTSDHSAVLNIVYATVHTGLDTPVHAEDNIWIPASSSMFEYEGNWQEIDESGTPPSSRMRELLGGAGSVSTAVIATRFEFHSRVVQSISDRRC